jgi:hypothetical protein
MEPDREAITDPTTPVLTPPAPTRVPLNDNQHQSLPMKISGLTCAVFLSGFLRAQSDALSAPHFHHLHLNSVNPDSAIDFYTRQFPSTSRLTLAACLR